MAIGGLEVVGAPAEVWSPRRFAVDPASFDCGRVGPYALGPEIRVGSFGPVHLALGSQFEEILEVERVEVSGIDTPERLPVPCDPLSDGVAPRVLERLNHCVGLRHPHVATVLGAGLDGDAPYVLRAHVLGRTLGELALDEIEPPADVAVGILYSVADGLAFLAECGPAPGICGLGGWDGHSVHIGWDGGIRLIGAGFSFLRDRRPDADLESLRAMASRFAPSLGRLVEDATELSDAGQRIRRWRREACAERQQRAAEWLREVDAEGCDAYRRFFSLPPLH